MRLFLLAFGALTVACAIAVALLYRDDMARAQSRLAGRSSIAGTPLGPVEYATLGKGDPVLVIHGAGGGFDQALDMTGTLADYDYELIAPSRFGYLRTPMPHAATVAQQADAFVALLDHLHLHAVDVVAISAGAWSALDFASRYPDRCRSLVLLVPAPPMPEQRGGLRMTIIRTVFGSDFIAWAMFRMLPVLPAAATEMILGTEPAVIRAASQREKDRVVQLVDHLLPVHSRTDGMIFDIASATIPLPANPRQISCPVLAIAAGDNAPGAARAKTLARRVQHGRSVIYRTGGHALVGDYDDVARKILQFLADVHGRRETSPPAPPANDGRAHTKERAAGAHS
jgi:pimeloyl-ACP methyl ester carboxylesterase